MRHGIFYDPTATEGNGWPAAETVKIVFCLALAARLINVIFLPTDAATLLQGDASLYWRGAGVWMEHGTFSRMIGDMVVPQTGRVPGYFLFLAAIRSMTGESLIAVLVAQSIVDSVTCVLIAAMAAILSRRLALPAGILAALWPNLIIHSGEILSDCLFLLLFTAVLTASARFLRWGEPRWAAAAGFALGLAIMTRPVAQMLPFAMAPVAYAVVLRRRRAAGPAALAAALFLGAAVAPLAPLLYRNFTQFDSVALTSQTGGHMIGWVAPLVRRAADGTPREVGARDLNARILPRIPVEDENNPFKRSRAISRLGLEAIAQYPVSVIVKAWAAGAAVNFAAPAVAIDRRVRALPHRSFDRSPGAGVFQQTRNFLTGSSAVYFAIMGASILLSVVFLGLQGYGFVVLARAAPWAAFFAALCIGYFLAVNGPVGSPKYRLPFEPVLILLGALALIDLKIRFMARARP